MTPDQIRARYAEGMSQKAIERFYGVSNRAVAAALKDFAPSPLNIETTRLWEQCQETGGCSAGDDIVWRATELNVDVPIPVCHRCGVPMRKLGKGFGRTENAARPKVWTIA